MEQRPQARQDALNRVCSAVTQLVSPFVAINLNIHAGLQRKTSGQLRNLGLMRPSAPIMLTIIHEAQRGAASCLLRSGEANLGIKYAVSRRIYCAISYFIDS
jgi:hypothetical protein